MFFLNGRKSSRPLRQCVYINWKNKFTVNPRCEPCNSDKSFQKRREELYSHQFCNYFDSWTGWNIRKEKEKKLTPMHLVWLMRRNLQENVTSSFNFFKWNLFAYYSLFVYPIQSQIYFSPWILYSYITYETIFITRFLINVYSL